jgi:hypothetical protein
MLRPFRVRAIALAALAAAGCQDYSFNPVGKCMLQPGAERVPLSDVSTADILFVVDDSGSMAGEQTELAENFGVFIENLDGYNAERTGRGLEPIDFHVAVTSTSIFFNESVSESRCRNDCPGAAGQNVCCTMSTSTNPPTPVAQVRQAKSCASSASVCTGGTSCRNDCVGLLGEPYCCDPSTQVAPENEPIACAAEQVDERCGTLQQHYAWSSTPTHACNADANARGVAVNGWRYPQGDFVSWTSASAANPRVLHFDKELYRNGANRQGFTAEELKAFFVGGVVGGGNVGGNVIVGTCGSGEEQALQAARRAIEKAIDGQQRDTYDIAGNLSWTAATRTAGGDAEWPHPNAKLVLVFVGDEDDCSSPVDSSGGVVWLPTSTASDTCVDANKGEMHKQYDVAGMVDFFASLGRPLGAAFIFPAAQVTCSGEGCTPGLCCPPECGSTMSCSANCGAQSPGNRLSLAAAEFRKKTPDVVTGSICDPSFGTILSSIADIVKPPSSLVLPTLPASTGVTVLRITDRAGLTRETCRGPAPDTMTEQEAVNAGYDWWFTEQGTTRDPSAASLYVRINTASGNCEANPGETYSADYLGRVPESGCTTRQQCADELGGAAQDWGCYIEPAQTVGTCVCCAPGSSTPECQ